MIWLCTALAAFSAVWLQVKDTAHVWRVAICPILMGIAGMLSAMPINMGHPHGHWILVWCGVLNIYVGNAFWLTLAWPIGNVTTLISDVNWFFIVTGLSFVMFAQHLWAGSASGWSLSSKSTVKVWDANL